MTEAEGASERSVETEESAVRRLLRLLTTLAAAGTLLALLAHLLLGDSLQLVVWIHALVRWFPLVALPLLVLSGLLRAGLPAALSGVTLLLWAPLWLPPPAPDPLPSGTRVKLATANALCKNPWPEQLVEEILAETPDIVLVQEHTTAMHAGLVEHFAYHRSIPQTGPKGMGLYTRFPILDLELVELGTAPWMRATLDIDGQPLTVWNVHTVPPMNPDKHTLWLGQVATLVAQAGEDDTPLVAAGDFNLTPEMDSYAQLVEAGLVDAHVDCGRGPIRTFPANERVPMLPPFLQLDYVFLRGGVRCASIREGSGPGSDHLPLYTELVLPAAER